MTVVTNNEDNCNLALIALKDVLDPEVGLNVVDLGLIYSLNFNEDKNYIFVIMTLTTQFCPMGESIRDSVKQTLGELFKGYNVDIDVVFDPPWSMELISEEGRKFLER
ncbi:MAG TPA: metal-sulfur cluster assembly factor [Mucilaginibacter sp.]|nr:metal-sulfur cluster assembly factor [Mucilaginibacter sp.]